MTYLESGYDGFLKRTTGPVGLLPNQDLPGGLSLGFNVPELTIGTPVVQSGGRFESAPKGARVEIMPDRDKEKEVGLRVYDDGDAEVFKCLVGGTDVGDVVIGDFAGGQGAKYDKSANTFSVSGALIAGELHIPDQDTTANSAHIASDGDTWWGATETDFNADNDNANAYVLKDGSAKFQSVTISGLQSGSDMDGQYLTAATVANSARTRKYDVNLMLNKFADMEQLENGHTFPGDATTRQVTTSQFYFGTRSAQLTTTGSNDSLYFGSSETDYNIPMLPSTKYIISAYVKGNAGSEQFRFAIKQDDAVTKQGADKTISGTAWQRITDTITTDSNLTNSGELVMAGRSNGTFFIDGVQVELASAATTPDPSDWKAGAFSELHGQTLTVSTVTAASMNVSQLSAIAADLGTITAGNMTIDSSGYIQGGATNYLTGTGFWMGFTSGAYKFHIGNPSGDHLDWTGTELRVNGSALANESIYGDGSDGSATISSNTNLTEDKFYTDLTINSGVTLNPSGYRIFVNGTLTVNGTIARNGNDGGDGGNGGNGVAATPAGGAGGTAGTAGASLADGSLIGAVAGITGQAGGVGADSIPSGAGAGGTGGVGTSVAKSLASAGVAGVSGGGGETVTGIPNLGAGSAGTGGSAGSKTGTVFNKINTYSAAYMLYDVMPAGSPDNLRSSAGSAGGGAGGGGDSCTAANGAGGGGGGSGGAGSPGGIVSVFARTIVVNASGKIQANGGDGGNGGNGGNGDVSGAGNLAAGGGGGGSGGAGGSGGVLVLVYNKLTNSGTIEAAGGTGGSGGTKGAGATQGTGGVTGGANGTAGNNGNAGVIIQLEN